eukprot:GHVS01075836.1.p1 GENE.GHVS01075836.1~~GHVS01075836.1.p1  ORF type:complete len:285 (-),score=55.67 GHVS01075836.1:160-918(-)
MSVVAAAQVLRGRDRRRTWDDQDVGEGVDRLDGPDVCEEESGVRYLSEDLTVLSNKEGEDQEEEEERPLDCSEREVRRKEGSAEHCGGDGIVVNKHSIISHDSTTTTATTTTTTATTTTTPTTITKTTTTSVSMYIKRLFDCLDVFTDTTLTERTYTEIVRMLQDKVDFPFSPPEAKSFAHKLTLGTAEHAVMLQELKLHLRYGRQNSIHTTPSVHVNGLIDRSIDSSWSVKQWTQYIRAVQAAPVPIDTRW